MKNALLDNKTKCEILNDNGILAVITNGEKTIVVFSFRLKELPASPEASLK